MKRIIVLIVSCILLLACTKKANQEAHNVDSTKVKIPKNDFDSLVDLTELKQTEFVPTLEHKVNTNINVIYSASLLLAWDEFKKASPKPIVIDSKYEDLFLMNNSTSYKNVLNKDEYQSSLTYEDGGIIAKAFFEKQLPFASKLTVIDEGLKFKSKKVKAFGQKGYDYLTADIIDILFYKNDDDFVIRLNPIDSLHEIILIKSAALKNKSFVQMNKILVKNIELGYKENNNPKLYWKYVFNDEDELVIPKINFNIQHNYNTMVGNIFDFKDSLMIVLKCYQKTAFVLDENGGIVESEAEIGVEAPAAEEAPEERPHPKKMKFDKPFLIVLKKKNAKNPYLCAWIANTELMKK